MLARFFVNVIQILTNDVFFAIIISMNSFESRPKDLDHELVELVDDTNARRAQLKKAVDGAWARIDDEGIADDVSGQYLLDNLARMLEAQIEFEDKQNPPQFPDDK